MTHNEKTERYQALAEECMKAERYEEAVIFYRKLVELNPGDDSFLVGLAWACHDSGKVDVAVDCFEKVFEKELRRKIFTGFAFDELVRIFKEGKEFDRLVRICERVIAAYPEDIALLGDLGEAYLKAGRPADAAVVYRKMTEMEPDASAFFCRLGHALVAMADFEQAEEAYRRAADIDPSEASAFYSRLAHAYLQAGQAARAERIYRQCLRERNDDPFLYLSLGDILIHRGELADGMAAYEKAAALNEGATGAYLNRLGNTLARANRHAEAVATFKKAIALEPTNTFYYLYLAESYRALGQTDRVAETVLQAESIKENGQHGTYRP
jgi:tetratricopeptide (TPR) repeat protein